MTINFKKYAPKKGHVLCLKSLQANLIASHNDFQWPSKGKCIAPDWKPTTACGNGLHAFLWGAGDGDLRCKDEDAKWLVMSVDASTIIDLDSKVKFPECEVVFCGDRETAIAIILHFAPSGTPVMFGTATAGYRGTATAGYRGTATAGDRGTATAGDRGTATAGYRGTATAGDRGTATAGYSGTATAGYRGTATAGYSGTATAGDRGTATAGDRGTATAGYSGTATAGDRGTATAGYSGTATAGYRGTATAGDSGTATAGPYGFIVIEYKDQEKDLWLKKMAFVDNVTILAGVKYRLNASNEFEAVNDSEA